MPSTLMDQTIAQALHDARAQGIVGEETTPFLLERIGALTQGGSLAANIALVLGNARLASAVARAMGR